MLSFFITAVAGRTGEVPHLSGDYTSRPAHLDDVVSLFVVPTQRKKEKVIKMTLRMFAKRWNSTMPTKKRRIYSYLDESQWGIFQQQVEKSGLSNAEYIARVCTGQRVASRVDSTAVKEMANVNADLGRLGGLLKLGLSAKTIDEAAMRRVLKKIERTQEILKDKVMAL